MFFDGETTDPPKPESVKYDKVIWGKQEWDFLTAMKDKTGNTVTITYTGSPIKPTVKNVTYLKDDSNNPKPLRLAKPGDPTGYYPLNYDYRYVYGNPNPEQDTSSVATDKEITNVTPKNSPSCMTLRFTTGGNFKNYVNVFYRIVPAQLSSAKFTAIPAQGYSIKGAKPNPKITFNGKTLVNGKDYSLTYSNNTKLGTGKVVVKGKGNFVGSKTLSFSIKKTSASKLSVSKIKTKAYTARAIKKGIKPSVKVKHGNTILKRGVHYTVTYKNHKKVGTASVVIKGKGNYTGTKKIKYKINRK
jgi:hypothetical protein